MEIEVITTKKKLSKAIVKQLEPATFNDIAYFNTMPTIGYYVRDLGASFPARVALFEGLNGWRIIGLRDWTSCGDDRIEASAKDFGRRGVSVKTLSSRSARDEYLSEYNKMKDSCLKNHLIL